MENMDLREFATKKELQETEARLSARIDKCATKEDLRDVKEDLGGVKEELRIYAASYQKSNLIILAALLTPKKKAPLPAATQIRYLNRSNKSA